MSLYFTIPFLPNLYSHYPYSHYQLKVDAVTKGEGTIVLQHLSNSGIKKLKNLNKLSLLGLNSLDGTSIQGIQDISSLTNLTFVEISGGSLSGNPIHGLPSQLATLIVTETLLSDLTKGKFHETNNLVHLDLSKNGRLSKLVNEENPWISSPYLTTLVLDETKLSYLSSNVFANTTRIQYFSIKNLKGKNLGKLPYLPVSLTYLNAENSGVTGLYGDLPSSLIELYLENNAITTLPSLELLSSLKRFEISYNKLTAFPKMPTAEDIFDPSPLTRIEASNNLLTSFSDSTWVHLERLLWLDLSYNQITTVPKLYKTKDIFLSHNKINSMAFVPLEPKFNFDWYGKGMYVQIQDGTCESHGYRNIYKPQECSNAGWEMSQSRSTDPMTYLNMNKGHTVFYTKNSDTDFPPWCSYKESDVYFNDALNPTRANTGVCSSTHRCYCKKQMPTCTSASANVANTCTVKQGGTNNACATSLSYVIVDNIGGCSAEGYVNPTDSAECVTAARATGWNDDSKQLATGTTVPVEVGGTDVGSCVICENMQQYTGSPNMLYHDMHSGPSVCDWNGAQTKHFVCKSEYHRLATCSAANIPNTCTVTEDGTNTNCAAAIFNKAACTAASSSGGAGSAANACIFVDNSVHDCIFVDNSGITVSPHCAAVSNTRQCAETSVVHTCTVLTGGTNTACEAANADAATCAAATISGNTGDAANNCVFVDKSCFVSGNVYGQNTIFDETWLDNEGQFLWSATHGPAGERKHQCSRTIRARDRSSNYASHGDIMADTRGQYAYGGTLTIDIDDDCAASYVEHENEDYRTNNDRIGCGKKIHQSNGQTGDWDMWQRLYFNGCIGHIDVSYNELKDLSTVPFEAPSVGWFKADHNQIVTLGYRDRWVANKLELQHNLLSQLSPIASSDFFFPRFFAGCSKTQQSEYGAYTVIDGKYIGMVGRRMQEKEQVTVSIMHNKKSTVKGKYDRTTGRYLGSVPGVNGVPYIGSSRVDPSVTVPLAPQYHHQQQRRKLYGEYYRNYYGNRLQYFTSCEVPRIWIHYLDLSNNKIERIPDAGAWGFQGRFGLVSLLSISFFCAQIY